MAAPSGQAALPLKGRVAIVTGGAGGIGSTVSKHLASLGAHVVIGYVGDPTPAETLASAINATTGATSGPPRAIAVAADVSIAAQVKSLFDAAVNAFGPDLHILVTTAAVIDADYPSIAETSEEKFDWMFLTNCKGTFLCCREAAKRLVRGGGGRIITFSSSGVGSLRPGYGVYSGTKGAVEVMTKILARELKGTGITANVVAPGSIETPMYYAGKSEEDSRKYMGGDTDGPAGAAGGRCSGGGVPGQRRRRVGERPGHPGQWWQCVSLKAADHESHAK